MSEREAVAAGDLVLVMEIGGRLAAVRAVEVASVDEVERIVPVPGAPPQILGLGAQRSRALTVLDACRAVGVEAASAQTSDDERCLIVVREEYFYAVKPDRVLDVGPAAGDELPLPQGLGDGWSRTATGTIETSYGAALLLDLDALLRGPEVSAGSHKAAA